MQRFIAASSTLALIMAMPALAQAQNSGLDEIIVTATKRSASAQDIPVAVSALGEQTLDELRVDVFTDYLVQLPGVTAGGSGPGQSTIYIRGLASTTPNLTTAGVAGLAPNVAFYLDEQPLAQPGRNLDVFAADLERVEVLSGPQGTLFGASSQAGTVRLITNKPKIGVEEARIKSDLSFTAGGEESYSFEAVYNIPVNDDAALRAVAYYDRAGGYIDNVPGTRTALESARFREQGTVRANGVPVSANRTGFQAGADLSAVNFIAADNSDIVANNINDTEYLGFRLSGLWEVNDDWKVTLSAAHQEIDSDGVFFSDPTLDDDFDVQLFEDSRIEDEFDNVSWTVEGRLGALEALYTGAFTNRSTEQRVDYSDYLFVGQYLPYYICDGSVSYPGAAAPSGTCQAPNLFVDSSTETDIQTHELRFNTPQENRLRATFGGFYSDLELLELNDFTYPGSVNVLAFDGVTRGFGPNFPLTNTAVTGEVGNAAPGFFTDPGPFPAGVIFRNDIRRTDQQIGAFGEATFDVTEQFALTLGARWYDIEVDLEGSANSSFNNLGATVDAQAFGTNISAQFAENNNFGAPDTAQTDGVIFKVTGTYQPNSDMLFYATYSQGFRPGLLNRPGGRQNSAGTFTVPFAVDTDDVDNFEFGWKADLLDNQLRFNGNVFYVDVTNLQTTIFDPSIVNLFFSANAANAEILGLEGDITYVPQGIEGLTLSGAFSLLDTEITEVLLPTNDVDVGDSLAFAPSFQGNLRARYEWDIESFGDGLTGHIMPQIIHTTSSFSDIININRDEISGWTSLGLSAGVTADKWSFEVYGDNLTNGANEISRNFINDRERVTLARPLTIGARVSYDFN